MAERQHESLKRCADSDSADQHIIRKRLDTGERRLDGGNMPASMGATAGSPPHARSPSVVSDGAGGGVSLSPEALGITPRPQQQPLTMRLSPESAAPQQQPPHTFPQNISAGSGALSESQLRERQRQMATSSHAQAQNTTKDRMPPASGAGVSLQMSQVILASFGQAQLQNYHVLQQGTRHPFVNYMVNNVQSFMQLPLPQQLQHMALVQPRVGHAQRAAAAPATAGGMNGSTPHGIPDAGSLFWSVSNIHEDAYRGNLTVDLLTRYLSEDISIIDSPGGRKSLTPLAAATSRGHLDVVHLLLENLIRPADPDALSSHNRTPLFFATSRSPTHNRRAIVRLLLDNRADVDLCYADDNYNTPLMNAIIRVQDKRVVHDLVDCGASLFRENGAGETAMTLAKKMGMEADLRPRNERTPSKGQTPDSATPTLSTSSRAPSGSRTITSLQVEDAFPKNTNFCLDGRIIRDNPNPLGFGGFADVYQGIFENRKVAIKVVRHFGLRQEKMFRRLWREYLAWSHLSHPNILVCLGYAYDFSSGAYALPSLISPWMENGTCLEYLETRPNADRLDLLIGIGYGLHHLHTRHPVIVHGDLRAGNILVSDQGVPCLTDFGLSRVLEEIKGMTTSSDVAGTLRWMSPELFKSGSTVSIQSDVWAYGMTILEILTGQRPYLEEKHDPAVFGLVNKGEVPSRPRGVDGQELINDKVWAACLRCWSFKPAIRPSIDGVVSMIMWRRPPSAPSNFNARSSPAIFDAALARSDESATPRVLMTLDLS